MRLARQRLCSNLQSDKQTIEEKDTGTKNINNKVWTSWECYQELSCFKEKEQSHRMLWTRGNQPRPVINVFKFFTFLLFCLGQATAHLFPVQPGQHQCGRQALPDWEDENWLGLLCLWVFTTSQTLPDLRLVGTTQREYFFLIPTIIQVTPPQMGLGALDFLPWDSCHHLFESIFGDSSRRAQQMVYF